MSVRKPPVPNPNPNNSGRALRRLTPSSSTSNPRHSQAVAHYWRATCDTNAFHAPFGRPAGDVEEGTVVMEGLRFVDCFDDMWLAVQSDDGDVLWIRRYAAGNLSEPKEAEWEPVADSATPGIVAEAPIPQIDINDNVMNHALALVTPDAAYMHHYWEKLHKPEDKDWNFEFQSALEDILYKHTSAAVDSRKALVDVYSAFADEVETTSAVIVKEMVLPGSQRTITRHPSSVDVFYHNGILFRLCVDTSGGFYGGDKNAIKVASQYHKVTHYLLQQASRYFLYLPLVTIMTVGGYRVIASSIPPIDIKRTVVGQCGGEQGSMKPVPVKLMNRFGEDMGLKPHPVGKGLMASFPCDAQLFAGLDHRLYLLNTGRSFPPAAPSTRCPVYHPLTTPLFQRIRPEILRQCGRLLNPDAFFPDCTTPESNSEIVTITQWQRDEGIPTVSAIIGMIEAVDKPEQNSVICVGCEREVDNELRFNVCRHEDACCMICMQCYIDTLKLDIFDENVEGAAKKLQSFVKCDAGEARGLRGLVMYPDVTSIFHANCVNMRFLSMVYHRLPESAIRFTGHYLEIEMIARSAKQLLWHKLRSANGPEEARLVCVNFFLALLQSTGDVAETFWANDLGPAIQSQFDIFVPFRTEELDNELVCKRVSDLTGIELTDASVRSFASDAPFVQLKCIHPVMKTQQIPHLVDEVGEHQKHLRGNLEDLLMFWIGEGAVTAEWEPKQPQYLKEKF